MPRKEKGVGDLSVAVSVGSLPGRDGGDVHAVDLFRFCPRLQMQEAIWEP